MHTHHEVNFSTDVEGLDEATSPEVIRLRDGDVHEITIKPVRKRIGDAEVRMLGYNGSIPGPTLHVDQDSEVTIEATNLGDVDATLHWHGLRLENRFDGVPEETQAPIPHGGKFTYRLQFPDPGFYWYHPHIREDFAQEMGLYAGIIVEPSDPDYWPPADRELAITLDDILIEDGQIAPFERSGPTFTAMGRFGNVMLINGETEYRAEAKVGEVVRLHLVDTANTRIFNFAISGARMKLVGGDSGRVEREEFIDEVLLSPSERVTVDVLFDQPGEVVLENRTPDHTYELGRIVVSGEARPARPRPPSTSCGSTPSSRPSASASRPTWSASRTRPWPSSRRCRSSTGRRASRPRATSARCTPRSPTPRPRAARSAG